MLGIWRKARLDAGIAAGVGFFFAGILIDLVHVPGPPLRQAALDRIARLYHGGLYQTGMIQALLIGQNFQLQRVWTEVYRSTGTFHVIVISGTHVAILAAFFPFLLRVCFVPESLALLTTVVTCWFYAPRYRIPGARCPLGGGPYPRYGLRLSFSPAAAR
jgi:predicted membrane metal-binding protein